MFFFAWHLASKTGNILLPPLSEIMNQFSRLLSSGILLTDTADSLLRVLGGLAVSCLVAIALGIATVFWRPLSQYLHGVVELLRPIPPIAWVPIAIIAFGIGTGPAIAIVALGSFFPIWLGIQQGLDEVRRSHMSAAMSLGASRFLMLVAVTVPSALPYFLHGLRLGVGIAWFCVIASEMAGSSSGLGYGVQLLSMNIEMSKVYCYLLAIGMVGLASNTLVLYLYKRVSHWKENDIAA